MDRAHRVLTFVVAALLILLGGRGVLAAGLEADRVVYNGKILTANTPDPNNFTTAQAAAV